MSEGAFTSFADWWAGRRMATSAAFFLTHLEPGVALTLLLEAGFERES